MVALQNRAVWWLCRAVRWLYRAGQCGGFAGQGSVGDLQDRAVW